MAVVAFANYGALGWPFVGVGPSITSVCDSVFLLRRVGARHGDQDMNMAGAQR